MSCIGQMAEAGSLHTGDDICLDQKLCRFPCKERRATLVQVLLVIQAPISLRAAVIWGEGEVELSVDDVAVIGEDVK